MRNTDIDNIVNDGTSGSTSSSSIFTNNKEYVTELHISDVLFGRGSGPNEHDGNIKFRTYVADRKVEYMATNHRLTKTKIAREIVSIVFANNGRFLKKLEPNEIQQLGFTATSSSNNDEICFYEVQDDETVMEKAKQALRQNATKFREEIMSSSSVVGGGVVSTVCGGGNPSYHPASSPLSSCSSSLDVPGSGRSNFQTNYRTHTAATVVSTANNSAEHFETSSDDLEPYSIEDSLSPDGGVPFQSSSTVSLLGIPQPMSSSLSSRPTEFMTVSGGGNSTTSSWTTASNVSSSIKTNVVVPIIDNHRTMATTNKFADMAAHQQYYDGMTSRQNQFNSRSSGRINRIPQQHHQQVLPQLQETEPTTSDDMLFFVRNVTNNTNNNYSKTHHQHSDMLEGGVNRSRQQQQQQHHQNIPTGGSAQAIPSPPSIPINVRGSLTMHDLMVEHAKMKRKSSSRNDNEKDVNDLLDSFNAMSTSTGDGTAGYKDNHLPHRGSGHDDRFSSKMMGSGETIGTIEQLGSVADMSFGTELDSSFFSNFGASNAFMDNSGIVGLNSQSLLTGIPDTTGIGGGNGVSISPRKNNNGASMGSSFFSNFSMPEAYESATNNNSTSNNNNNFFNNNSNNYDISVPDRGQGSTVKVADDLVLINEIRKEVENEVRREQLLRTLQQQQHGKPTHLHQPPSNNSGGNLDESNSNGSIKF